MVLLYGLVEGWGRIATAVLVGVVLLAGTTLASCRPDGPSPVLVALAVVVAVCLGWWGYRSRCRQDAAASAEMLLETRAIPFSSAQAVDFEDVLGTWRFYVDAAASTVTIDLQADGRYRQVIVSNSGTRIDCPGGIWTLDGPYLELASYRSASRAVTGPVHCFFSEWQKELVLLVRDDPQEGKTLQARHD
jgi:hypothetical protein